MRRLPSWRLDILAYTHLFGIACGCAGGRAWPGRWFGAGGCLTPLLGCACASAGGRRCWAAGAAAAAFRACWACCTSRGQLLRALQPGQHLARLLGPAHRRQPLRVAVPRSPLLGVRLLHVLGVVLLRLACLLRTGDCLGSRWVLLVLPAPPLLASG